jgi:hypothetical protein
MIDKYLDHLVQKLGEKVKDREESLGASAAKDFAEYRYMCGEIQGLLSARQELLDLKQRLENSNE